MDAVRHIGIVARDLNMLREFYEKVFGLQPAGHDIESGAFIETLTGVSGARLEWVKLSGNNGVLVELLHYHGEGTPLRPPLYPEQQGTAHVAFTVEDAHRTGQCIREMGGSAGTPLKNPQGTVLVFYAQDPEGNQLEVVQPFSLRPSSLRGLSFNKCMDYENGFYWFSDPRRIGKVLAQYELYRKIAHVQGAVVETGVFKGSTLLRLATFRKLLESEARPIFAFDMFAAFPQESALQEEKWYAQSYDANFGLGLSVKEMEGILVQKGIEANVTLIEGDICKTMPDYFEGMELAFVHVDVELYAPTKTIIEECWSRLSSGGLMVFDDYDEATSSKAAIDEFALKQGVRLQSLEFINTPVFCVKC